MLRKEAVVTLTKLHTDNRDLLSGYLGPFGLICFSWVIILFQAYLSRDPGEWANVLFFGRLLAVFTSILVIVLLVIRKAKSTYRTRLHRLIADHRDQSELIPGLGRNPFEIKHYVPWLFRHGYPNEHHRNSARSGITLLAKNIDWYLGRPRRFWRLRWFQIYAIIVPIVITIIWMYYLELSGYFLVQHDQILLGPWFIGLICCTFLMMLASMCEDLRESIRVEVYRDFVLDWYKTHSLEDAGD